jgi:hypothetical protein
MKAMATLIEKLVGWLKSEPEYRLQESHASKDLIYVIYYRLVQCTRGLRIRLTLGRCSGLLFCGRHVVIEHGYKISAGKGLILEDGIHVNALSGNGVVFGRNVTIKAGAIIVCSGVIKNKGVGLRVGDYSAIQLHRCPRWYRNRQQRYYWSGGNDILRGSHLCRSETADKIAGRDQGGKSSLKMIAG